MFLRNFLGLAKPSLTPLEQRLIAIVTDKLPASAASLLTAQLRQVNLVQRHSEQKEVNLYAQHGRQNKFDHATLFPLKSEAKLATVKFRCLNLDKPITAEMWIVDGHLFSFEFNNSPKICAEADIEVLTVTVHIDPLTPIVSSPETLVAPLHGWIKEWSEQGLVKFIRRPLSQEKRDELIRELETQLPLDYLEAIAQSEGLSINGWQVFGLSEIRSVIETDKSYYLLAEKENSGVVGVVRSDWSGDLHYINFEDNRDRVVGRSLKQFIECGCP